MTDLMSYREAIYQLEGINTIQRQNTKRALRLDLSSAAIYQLGDIVLFNAVDQIRNRNVTALFQNGEIIQAFMTSWDVERDRVSDIQITDLRTGRVEFAERSTQGFIAAYKRLLQEFSSDLFSIRTESNSLSTSSYSSTSCIGAAASNTCDGLASAYAATTEKFSENWGSWAAQNYFCVGFALPLAGENLLIPKLGMDSPISCAANFGYNIGKAMYFAGKMVSQRS